MKIEIQNAPAFVRHIQTLSSLSNDSAPYQFDLFIKLSKLEAQANRICTAECNGDISEDVAGPRLDRIKKKVLALLPKLDEKDFFINGDPRGYSLKIREQKAKELGIYTDWGSYGILAPTF